MSWATYANDVIARDHDESPTRPSSSAQMSDADRAHQAFVTWMVEKANPEKERFEAISKGCKMIIDESKRYWEAMPQMKALHKRSFREQGDAKLKTLRELRALERSFGVNAQWHHELR